MGGQMTDGKRMHARWMDECVWMMDGCTGGYQFTQVSKPRLYKPAFNARAKGLHVAKH